MTILRRLYLTFNRHKNYQFPVDYQQTWGSLDRAGRELQVDMSAKVSPLAFASLWRSDCQPFTKNSFSDGLVVQVRETNEEETMVSIDQHCSEQTIRSVLEGRRQTSKSASVTNLGSIRRDWDSSFQRRIARPRLVRPFGSSGIAISSTWTRWKLILIQ